MDVVSQPAAPGPRKLSRAARRVQLIEATIEVLAERGYARACFCTVDRPADHPDRPEGYSPLDSFWQKRGYGKLPAVTTRFTWPTEPGGPDLPHPMTYWMRKL